MFNTRWTLPSTSQQSEGQFCSDFRQHKYVYPPDHGVGNFGLKRNTAEVFTQFEAEQENIIVFTHKNQGIRRRKCTHSSNSSSSSLAKITTSSLHTYIYSCYWQREKHFSHSYPGKRIITVGSEYDCLKCRKYHSRTRSLVETMKKCVDVEGSGEHETRRDKRCDTSSGIHTLWFLSSQSA